MATQRAKAGRSFARLAAGPLREELGPHTLQKSIDECHREGGREGRGEGAQINPQSGHNKGLVELPPPPSPPTPP